MSASVKRRKTGKSDAAARPARSEPTPKLPTAPQSLRADPVVDEAPNSGPGAMLRDAQVRTLADMCQALDLKSLELLDQLAAEHQARVVSERELAVLNKSRDQDRVELQALHQRELAEARRAQTMLERELAALRLVLERGQRNGSGDTSSRAERAGRQARLQMQAERLLSRLEARLAKGPAIINAHDTTEALTKFGVAGMLDVVQGTREAPVCDGWLLSRSDMETEPLMFLVDEAGVVGWTGAFNDRPDVNRAFPGTKPRPGFSMQLTRMPGGRLRGIVAVGPASAPVFFEASSRAIPAETTAAAG